MANQENLWALHFSISFTRFSRTLRKY